MPLSQRQRPAALRKCQHRAEAALATATVRVKTFHIPSPAFPRRERRRKKHRGTEISGTSAWQGRVGVGSAVET